MHSSLIGLVVLVALGWRWGWQVRGGSWRDRWQRALEAFCLPPLMLLSACAAILVMGHHGTMMGQTVSPFACWVSKLVWLLLGWVVLYRLARATWFGLRLRQYPEIMLPSGERARCLPLDRPFAAQAGFWRSALLVSQGWLRLSPIEQQAILKHEQAHARYGDPFWFFWLGVVRQFSQGLPQTQAIWAELQLLREIRADRWAAQETEPLLLAELLVKLSYPTIGSQPPLANGLGFSERAIERLEQRVEALLQPDWPESRKAGFYRLVWLVSAMVPFVTIWFHT